MVTTKKKTAPLKKRSTVVKKATTNVKKTVAQQPEYAVRVKLGLIVFIMLAFSFLLIVLTKYQ